jgi:hypothetical protein
MTREEMFLLECISKNKPFHGLLGHPMPKNLYHNDEFHIDEFSYAKVLA